jgi:hypothetical protein
MKCSSIKFSLCLFLMLLCVSITDAFDSKFSINPLRNMLAQKLHNRFQNSKGVKSLKSSHHASKKFNKIEDPLKANQTIISTGEEAFYDEPEAKVFSEFAHDSICASKPLAKHCPECLKGRSGYKFFFYFQTTRMRKFAYKLMIHYNDNLKKILITFSAPSIQNDYKYIKSIYTKDMYLVKFYQFKVEKEYAVIYFGKFRKILNEKIKEIKKSGRENYSYVFNGWSTGASIATLAGFDLTKKGVVTKSSVYTYGSLRIGDAAFVALVNTTIRVWRIVKAGDFVYRIPSCFFNPNMKIWKCYKIPDVIQMVKRKTYYLRSYVRGYVKMFSKKNSKISQSVKQKVKAIKNAKKKQAAKRTQNKKNKAKKIVKKAMKTGKKLAKNKFVKTAMKFGTKLAKNTPQYQMLKLGLDNAKKISKAASKTKDAYKNAKKNKIGVNRKSVKQDNDASKKSHKKIGIKREFDKKSSKLIAVPTEAHTGSSIITIPVFIPTHKVMVTYETFSDEDIFLKLIYYSQPIGYQIFYNDKMTSYSVCEYENGISVCERAFDLPIQFEATPHVSYFDANFNQCKPLKG